METIRRWAVSLFDQAKTVAPIGDNRRQFAIGIIVGAILLLLDRGALLASGFPYGGDTLSNLIPAAYFREALTSGSNPLVTPWYGGMFLWENGFFKGFYPPWWPLFIPGVSQSLYLKFILGMHYLVAGVVSYVSARREFHPGYALALTFVFLLPMAYFNAHISKTMAWPWVVLGVWQLTPRRLTEAPRRAGMLIGLSGGVILLIANGYFAFYLAILSGSILLAKRAWVTIRGAAVVSVIVGAPKLISVALSGGRDVPVITVRSVKPLIAGFTGIPVGWIQLEAYAVIGIPICTIAVITVVWAYWEPERFPVNWLLGCLIAGMIGALLATRARLLYQLPLVDTFRVAQRAVLLPAFAALLITIVFIHTATEAVKGTDIIPDRTFQAMVSIALILSVGNAAVPPLMQDQSATDPEIGRAVAQVAVEHDCEPVWLEIDGEWQSGAGTYHKEISYGLAEQRVAATAISYAKVGQEYTTQKNGRLTFEALILQNNETLPDRIVTLSGGWGIPARGTIDGSRFEVVDQINANGGAIRLYAPDGRC